MRANIVTGVLVVLLAVLVGGTLLRTRSPHAAPAVAQLPTDASAGVAGSGEVAAESASAPPASSAAPIPKDAPKLDRSLRVSGLGWDALAAGIVANDGAQAGPASALKKRGLDVRFTSAADADAVEAALARGGVDERGADVAILPLPRFVASYERLRALDPVIFLVVGWSEGREVVVSKGKGFDAFGTGDVKLRAQAGDAAAFLGLFALDVSGISGDRVKLMSKQTDAWDFAALAKRRPNADTELAAGSLLFSSAEASRLLPVVAIAQAGMLTKSEPAFIAFAEGWLEGQRSIAADATAAARKIGNEQGAPEPLALLSALGEIGPSSLGENAVALGLSGRGATTVEKLFTKSWDIWRGAKVLGVPPERAPVDGRVVAAMVRAGGSLTAPPAASSTRKESPASGKALLVHRAPKGKLDEDALLETVAFLAGAFPRSPVKVSLSPRGDVDKKATAAFIARAEERFGLAKGRVVEGSVKTKDGSAATVEVMPVP